MTLAQRARPEAAGPRGPVLASRKEFALDGSGFGCGSGVGTGLVTNSILFCWPVAIQNQC